MNNQNSIPQDNSSSSSYSSRESYGSGSNEPVGFAAHMHGADSRSQEEPTTPQKGGGATGYDKDQERQEVKHEQDEMYRERREEDVNVEREQMPTRENQQTSEGQAGTTGTQNIH